MHLGLYKQRENLGWTISNGKHHWRSWTPIYHDTHGKSYSISKAGIWRKGYSIEANVLLWRFQPRQRRDSIEYLWQDPPHHHCDRRLEWKHGLVHWLRIMQRVPYWKSRRYSRLSTRVLQRLKILRGNLEWVLFFSFGARDLWFVPWNCFVVLCICFIFGIWYILFICQSSMKKKHSV